MHTSEIHDLFETLKSSKRVTGGFTVEPVTKTSRILVGFTFEGDALCLVRQESAKARPSRIMTALRVDYAVPLTATLSGEQISEVFTCITLDRNQIHLLDVFASLLDALVNQLPADPTEGQIDLLVESFVELFKEKPGVPRDRLKGLFGELVLAHFATTPSVWVSAWHENQLSKHDFTFSDFELEVKTAESYVRKHKVSNSQLLPVHPTKRIFLVSVLVEESPTGLSIFDLMDAVLARLSDFESRQKVIESIYGTLGAFAEEARSIKWEVLGGSDHVHFYNSSELPLPACVGPSEFCAAISDIRFEINLEVLEAAGVKPIKYSGFGFPN